MVTIAGQRGCRGDDVTWPPVTQLHLSLVNRDDRNG